MPLSQTKRNLLLTLLGLGKLRKYILKDMFQDFLNPICGFIFELTPRLLTS